MKSYVASDLRDKNRETVFNLIAGCHEISRAELARISGISPPTVNKIVNFLLEEKLVLETGERGSSVGRKPTMLQLDKNALFAVGIVLEGDFIRAGIVNLNGDIEKPLIRRAREDFGENMTYIIPEVIDTLFAGTDLDRNHIRGIGIGVPGGYDSVAHVVNFAPLVNLNTPTYIGHYEQALSERFSVPIYLGNDANLAVFGEYRARRLNKSDLVYISMGTGLGAGIMLNGELRHGCTFQCGEIGYMTFLDYTAGREKPGWLESRINLRALKEKFGFDPYNTGNTDLRAIIDYVATPVAICISNIVSFLDCGIVVMGGILTQSLGDAFMRSLEKKVRNLCIVDVRVQKQISDDPGIAGASLMALDDLLQGILSGG